MRCCVPSLTSAWKAAEISDGSSRAHDFFALPANPPVAAAALAARALGRQSLGLPAMKALRRGLIVAVIAIVVGGFVKLRGKGGVPPTSGGWRELDGPEFR